MAIELTKYAFYAMKPSNVKKIENMQTDVSVQNDAYLIVLSTKKVFVYKQIVSYFRK